MVQVVMGVVVLAETEELVVEEVGGVTVGPGQEEQEGVRVLVVQAVSNS